MEWLWHIGVILLAAKLGAEVMQRLGMSAAVGEIIIGILLGPAVLQLIPDTTLIAELAEMGVLLMIFLLGLETKVAHLREVGGTALAVALGGIMVPFGLGYVLGWAVGLSWKTALFLGVALTATSVAVSTRVFQDVGLGRSPVTRTILAAAVIDDIVGLMILTIVLALTGYSQERIEVLLQKEALFLFLGLPLAWVVLPRMVAWVRHLHGEGALFAVTLGLTFAFAYGAVMAGFEPIVGAFVIGVIFGRTPDSVAMERQVTSLVHFLAPLFFVHMGLLIDLSALGQEIGFALLLTLVAVVTKLVGAGGLAMLCRLPPRDAVLIGLGMVPRGEVGLITAGIGARVGLFDHRIFAAAALMCVLTIVIVPPLLRAFTSRSDPAAASAPPHSKEAEHG